MARTVSIDFVGKDRLSRIQKKVQAGFRGIKTDTKKADTALKGFNKRQKKTAEGMKRLSTLKAAFGAAALVGIGKKALGAAATAETATLKVLSNITDAQEKLRLKPKIAAALEDAGKLGIPMEQAGAALFTMTSQLGASDATFKKFRGSMKLSVGGFADLQSSVSVTNKLMEQFSNLGDDSEKTARQIFEAQVLGDTDVQQLAQALPTAAGSAKTAGLKSEEFLSIISAQTKRTKNTQASAEALKALIASFQNVQKGTDRAKAFKSLGIAPGTENLKSQGLINILEKLVQTRGTKGGQALIDRAFTGEGAKLFLNNLDSGLVESIKTGAVKIREGSALDLSFKDVSESVATTLAKNEAELNKGFAIIGEQMVPALSTLSDAISNADTASKEEGGSFVGSLASQAGTGVLNIFKNISELIALNRENTQIQIDIQNAADARVGVTQKSGGEGVDLGVQERGA